jgi:hypothetical protein
MSEMIKMNGSDSTIGYYWEEGAHQQAFRQVADLCKQHTGLPIRYESRNLFIVDQSEHTPTNGIISIHGQLDSTNVISVRLKLISNAANVRVPATDFIDVV